MKKIGLLLGSFDPPHIGHVWAANYALNQGLDEVWVIPAWKNPWKENQTDFIHRLEMCYHTFDSFENIKVSNIDGSFKSTYTYEGLEELLKITNTISQECKDLGYQQIQFYIIGGTDIAKSISNWKNGDWILDHFNVLEVPRSGYTETPLGIECSSTSLRKMLQEGKSVVPFIDANTLTFIKDNKLYDSKHS